MYTNKIKTGLVREFKISLVKKNPALIDRVSKQRNIDPKLVEEMLYYNVWLVSQFSDLTGKSVSAVHGLLRPRLNSEGDVVTNVNFTYPFRSQESNGPVCIIRDEKSEAYL